MWTSKTGQFSESELHLLEFLELPTLIESLAASDPLVILRALVEIKENDGEQRLLALLADPVIAAKWHLYPEDPDTTPTDNTYAVLIREYLENQS